MTLLADRLNAMTARINTLMSAMREVTDNIAHDLRTLEPLARAVGKHARANFKDRYSGAIADEMDEQLAQSIHDIDMLLENFAAILSLSRLESGAVARSVLRSIWRRWSQISPSFTNRLVQETGGCLDVLVHDKSALVCGERTLISQAIANLLENALKYGASGENIGLELSRREGPDGVFMILPCAIAGPVLPPQTGNGPWRVLCGWSPAVTCRVPALACRWSRQSRNCTAARWCCRTIFRTGSLPR